jgi:protein tyrosine/serine phosphatase
MNETRPKVSPHASNKLMPGLRIGIYRAAFVLCHCLFPFRLRTKRVVTLTALLVITALLTACASRGLPPQHQITNFGQVDASLYRGAQPSRAGLTNLSRLGVKTVVNLRRDALPGEETTVRALGMNYLTAPLSGVGNPPSEEQLRELVRAIEHAPGPVFVHCQYGCDRTGLVVAAWRVRHGWDGHAALAEAKAYGISPLLTGFQARILQLKPN